MQSFRISKCIKILNNNLYIKVFGDDIEKKVQNFLEYHDGALDLMGGKLLFPEGIVENA